MCGQLGVIFGNGVRKGEELQELTGIFTDILILSESRGFHATGVGRVSCDGDYQIYKQPVPAHEFVLDPQFHRVIDQVDGRTTVLMGHTRWKTRGSQYDNANNHPLESRFCLGTHNGHISNADALSTGLHLPRTAEVDSEVIFRIADTAVEDGRINPEMLARRLSLCRGQMSAVITTWMDPETIIVAKGDKPLEFRYSPRLKALTYASEAGFLDAATRRRTGWRRLSVPFMSLAVFRANNLPRFDLLPLSLIGPGTTLRR